MGTVQFVASVIDSVIWPVTVVVLVLVFRLPLHAILVQVSERIRTTRTGARHRPQQRDFETGVLQARELARRILANGPPGTALENVDDFDIEVLAARAEQEPRTLVLDSWRHLEDSLHLLARAIGIDRAELTSSYRVLQILAGQAGSHRMGGAVPAIDQLNRLRNDVHHDRGAALSPVAAHDYALTALRLALVIRHEGQRVLTGSSGPDA